MQYAAGESVDHHADISARQLDRLADMRDGTHMEHVVHRRIIHVHIVLCRQEDAAVIRHSPVQRLDRFFPAHIKMQDHMRKYHQSAKR